MTVTTNNCFSWLGQAKFWSNDMDNPLIRMAIPANGTPNSDSFFLMCHLFFGNRIIYSFDLRVGTLWSIVANVKSGRRTFRSFKRNPSNA